MQSLLTCVFARPARHFAAVVLLAITAASCGSGNASPNAAVALRLGYFPNITHATAIAGVSEGIFARALGSTATLEPKTLNAGPAAIEALLSGAIDATYIGPNPAINAFVKSKGAAIRIVSGTTSGGAFLVVKPSINSPADLRGKKIASPQRGNTQDVALRSWLASKGFKTDLQGGGDVAVLPQENAQTLETFRTGAISGAWVPEPWASRLVLEGGGKVLVDERDLWPQGRYVTTHLIVRTDFLKAHSAVVAALLRGQVEANDFVNKNAAKAKADVATIIEQVTGTKLKQEVIDRAWGNLTFTNDPIATSLHTSAASAQAAGLLDKVDLTGIYDLALLNAALRDAGEQQVAAA